MHFKLRPSPGASWTCSHAALGRRKRTESAFGSLRSRVQVGCQDFHSEMISADAADLPMFEHIRPDGILTGLERLSSGAWNEMLGLRRLLTIHVNFPNASPSSSFSSARATSQLPPWLSVAASTGVVFASTPSPYAADVGGGVGSRYRFGLVVEDMAVAFAWNTMTLLRRLSRSRRNQTAAPGLEAFQAQRHPAPPTPSVCPPLRHRRRRRRPLHQRDLIEASSASAWPSRTQTSYYCLSVSFL
ncbi:hypothetical protein R3P38DRAFT_3174229 [Favolaschia claudopus]|uniref:Uncharacterized protein n=1 Tax=Favolaschia claudopus TaxID=2862362 RepID=A0AAW0DKY0_9AGAR